AGHVGLELRNVVANYRFERAHRFPGIAVHRAVVHACVCASALVDTTYARVLPKAGSYALAWSCSIEGAPRTARRRKQSLALHPQAKKLSHAHLWAMRCTARSPGFFGLPWCSKT